MPRVLQINQSDCAGGAAVAAWRLHQGLLKRGIDSRLLVGKVSGSDERVTVMPRLPLLEQLLWQITSRCGLNYLEHVGSFAAANLPCVKYADVIHLHNLHTGYMSYCSLPRIVQEKPAVLTLHDMWAFTGHCSYSYDCRRWRTGCGACPYPDEYPPVKRDATKFEWRLKDSVYRRLRLKVVAPSRWLTDIAQESMLGCFEVEMIPNGIDTNLYFPWERNLCRDALQVPRDANVLLWVAEDLADRRKGGDLLLRALELLPDSLTKEMLLLTIGRHPPVGVPCGVAVRHFSFVGDPHLQTVIYNAADLHVLPSRLDNAPLVIQEAMACGVPTVSFAVGGVPELVIPDETGYLAASEDSAGLAKGIECLLGNPGHSAKLGLRCREVAEREFPLESCVERYITLYSSMLAVAAGA
jgi:glycosyltransferase involved in cell wall biosynthesis